MRPTNPNNCKAKYKDFLKPQTLLWQAFQNPPSPEKPMLQNFMKVGMLGILFAKCEWSYPIVKNRCATSFGVTF